MEAVYWQIKNDYFIFPHHLQKICSAPGRIIEETVKKTETRLQIFLRGSLLEYENPFARADVDLFVLYNHSSQLNELSEILPKNDYYDIKLIPQGRLSDDYVFNVLLQCRSLQISGDKFERIPVKADKQFAWEHWIKYCPAMIPDRIDTQSAMALIYFKLLTRCFGVLSFQRHKLFTRDISECIKIAKNENSNVFILLKEMRECLESKKTKLYNVADVKKLLMNRFDEYYKCW